MADLERTQLSPQAFLGGAWTTAAPAPAAPAASLELVTWNTWFGGHMFEERTEALLDELARRRPDVIALQEVTPALLDGAASTTPWVQRGYQLSDVEVRTSSYGVGDPVAPAHPPPHRARAAHRDGPPPRGRRARLWPPRRHRAPREHGRLRRGPRRATGDHPALPRPLSRRRAGRRHELPARRRRRGGRPRSLLRRRVAAAPPRRPRLHRRHRHQHDAPPSARAASRRSASTASSCAARAGAPHRSS